MEQLLDGVPDQNVEVLDFKDVESRVISVFSYQIGTSCKILIPSMVERGPIHMDLEVGSKGLLLRWLSVKDADMMFAPTVGL